MVISKVKEQSVPELEAALDLVFGALKREEPQNVKYMSLKATDGVTFVAILEVDDGTENPLPALVPFQEFQARLPEWVEGPPTTHQLSLVGSYGFSGSEPEGS